MIECTACKSHVRFCNLGDHQPAFETIKSMDLTSDDNDSGNNDNSNSSDDCEIDDIEEPHARASSAVAFVASSAAAALVPTASVSVVTPVVAPVITTQSIGASLLLPPMIPPCNNCEVCPNRCEDPHHPGSDYDGRRFSCGVSSGLVYFDRLSFSLILSYFCCCCYCPRVLSVLFLETDQSSVHVSPFTARGS